MHIFLYKTCHIWYLWKLSGPDFNIKLSVLDHSAPSRLRSVLTNSSVSGREGSDGGEAGDGGHGEGEAGVPEDHVGRAGVDHADQSQVSVRRQQGGAVHSELRRPRQVDGRPGGADPVRRLWQRPDLRQHPAEEAAGTHSTHSTAVHTVLQYYQEWTVQCGVH